MWSMVVKRTLGWLADSLMSRRRVRFTVHPATFVATGRPAYFLNVVNLSRDREIEISHIWFASDPPLAALQPDRPLPRRLKPDEAWETWVYADQVPPSAHERITELGRARLSSGMVVRSRPNQPFLPEGTVPGGPLARME